MPAPIGDMTVYRQATLLYDKRCSGCGKVNAGKPDWAIRMRVCKKCKNDMCGGADEALLPV
jgi:hypothetical protein